MAVKSATGPDSTGVAAINATILSIFFAAASLYALFIFQGLHNLKTAIINLASHINDLRWGDSVGTEFASSYLPDEEGRRVAGRRLRSLLSGDQWIPDDGPPVGATPADRGHEVLGVMCALCSHYPFPTPWKRNDPWRPSTGYILFGADRSLEFAWLPSVPLGAVTVTYSVDGEQHETTGVGYHDHNWGNVGLMKVVHDWYWARGQAGPYSVIASYITSARKYGALGPREPGVA